ncbi:MAG TPA: BTAD domain-containing putative transcriptional regulator [Gemmatimonadota bacterium]|nr:BTAD domain-containing putative transcriptional regulator [Gemmatimonadota bacterium]
MSAEPRKAPPAPPFRLQTLGTLVLQGPGGGAPGADFAQQSRRLALLAALATAGERGRNRDQLLLFFWPDASQERARHSLEQALYLIRRSVDGSVFLGVNPLRLNPEVLGSDVEAFESAIREGRLGAAVELYGGPFLDGFYLGDAPEFEQWTEGERSRLEALYAKALGRLAEDAEGAGDPQAAVAWWGKLAETDPLSSRPVLGLMRGLAATGDHAAALRQAQRYERLVEEELGTSAGPEIAALAEEIRAGAKEAPRAVQRPLPAASLEDLEPPSSYRELTFEERSETSPGVPRAARGSRRDILVGALVVVLVAALLAVTRPWSEPAVPPAAEVAEPSIAVLPLSNLSAEPGDAVLADGMTEELIAMLAKTGDLRVIASTSAFAFRDRQTDVRSIADTLRVSNILEGGVQKIGSRLRVQVRLVDARDGSTRWSETYDREIEDLFVVQQEIASAVARELGARLGGRTATRPSRHTRNVAAYELYLRGNDPVNLRSDSGPHQALEYFRQAVALDSTYAAAYAGMSRMYARLRSTEDPGMPIRDLEALSLRAALKAVALDDSLAEAHAALGTIQMNVARDYRSAEMELKRAIELDPMQSRTHEWLVLLYLRTGRPAEALAEARRALEIDPLSPSAHAEVAHALIANGRYDEALAHLAHIQNVQPPLLRTAQIAAQAYAMKEMWEEAIAAIRPQAERELAAVSSMSQSAALYGYLLARSGQQEEADRVLQTLLARSQRTGTGAFDVATVYAGLGDFDQAFVWLDRAIEDGSETSHANVMEPVFEELRRDPRFKRVEERLGLQKR